MAGRRLANTQVSVEPNTSSSGAPKRRSAACASSTGRGAVADSIAATGGNAMTDSTSARRCTGVVTSTRGAGTSASAAATSAGKKGRPACTPAPPSNGSSTDISMPYMCCGGTVATISKRGPTTARSIARLPALLAWKLPQVLGFALGVPVEPEV